MFVGFWWSFLFLLFLFFVLLSSRESLRWVQLSGPTLFAPVINQVSGCRVAMPRLYCYKASTVYLVQFHHPFVSHIDPMVESKSRQQYNGVVVESSTNQPVVVGHGFRSSSSVGRRVAGRWWRVLHKACRDKKTDRNRSDTLAITTCVKVISRLRKRCRSYFYFRSYHLKDR